MKKNFKLKGFKGEVDMTSLVVPNSNFTWGELLHWKDFNYLDVRLPREVQHSYNIVNLIKKIQPIRETIGLSFKVTSGYRPDPYNRRAGGATRSKHKFGQAVDFMIVGLPKGVTHRHMASHIYYDLGFGGGVGGYSGWIHLDTGTRRKWGF